MKGLKTGGRTKGTPNRENQRIMELANRLNIDPFEVLLKFAGNDWEGLGYDSPCEERHSKDGSVYYVDRITAKDRIMAAKEIANYMAPKRASVQVIAAENASFNDMTDQEKLEKAKQVVMLLEAKVKNETNAG